MFFYCLFKSIYSIWMNENCRHFCFALCYLNKINTKHWLKESKNSVPFITTTKKATWCGRYTAAMALFSSLSFLMVHQMQLTFSMPHSISLFCLFPFFCSLFISKVLLLFLVFNLFTIEAKMKMKLTHVVIGGQVRECLCENNFRAQKQKAEKSPEPSVAQQKRENAIKCAWAHTYICDMQLNKYVHNKTQINSESSSSSSSISTVLCVSNKWINFNSIGRHRCSLLLPAIHTALAYVVCGCGHTTLSLLLHSMYRIVCSEYRSSAFFYWPHHNQHCIAFCANTHDRSICV